MSYSIADKSEFNKEEQQFIRDHMKRLQPYMISGFIFVSLMAYIVFNNTIDFAKFSKTSVKDLADFPSRIKYVLKHLSLGITWILMSVYFVIHRRVGTPAVDPMHGYERITEAAKNNLTNSIEQFLLSAFSQLILITDLDAIYILRVIPALNFLFIFGRITFWLGYPKFRCFGFILTNIPIVFTIAYNMYQFMELYF
jgi:hypothetical protein